MIFFTGYILPSILMITVVGINYILFPFLIWGLLPNFRARKLEDAEIEKVSSKGIVHFTSRDAADSILTSRIFNSSGWLNSYSTQFKKSTFFFINDCLPNHSKEFNLQKKKKKIDAKIEITNLTEEQIVNFKTRRFDNSVIYKGDFVISDDNIVSVVELEPSFSVIAARKKPWIKDRYHRIMVIRLILTVFVCIFPVVLYLIYVLSLMQYPIFY